MIERDRHFLSIFFNESIYAVEEPEPSEEATQDQPEIQYKGQNKQEVLVIVYDEMAEYISEKDEALLIKILQAVRLSPDDIALVNIHSFQNQAHNFIALNNISYKTLITFGETTEAMPFRKYLVKYQWNTDEQNRVYLQADALKDIAYDRIKKQLLWKNLQEIFCQS